MKPALELTSVPGWATTPTRPDADVSGRYWTVVAFGRDTADIVATWTAQLAARHPDAAPRVHLVDDDAAARATVTAALADAVVGWRLMIAGPADACLRLRAHALNCGVGDDEITVASTEVATRDVRCVHCGTVRHAAVDLEDVLPCTGCDRNLLVYYHVSRRLGAHLGFMIDAEQLPGERAS
jgi:dimethylamine monooxygenase subunit C